MDYGKFATEGLLEESTGIDRMTPLEIATVINNQDKTVAYQVEKALPRIAEGIELFGDCLKRGGHIFYVGAGTSGRLGVLDASECPPTYGVSPEVVRGIIAGGKEAAFASVEDAEDDDMSIIKQMQSAGFTANDLCIGISASGSAKCVSCAMEYAHTLGAKTICVTNNPDSALIPLADVPIVAVVGAEVIKGSTRMKAGTAQKMILNMLSTGGMVLYGRTYGNRMAYMIPSNKKLVARAVKMIADETGCDEATAQEALEQNGFVITEALKYIADK